MELDDDLYRIGNVATLTGVAVERLRAWERRYGLTPAHRAGKTRFYSSEQVERIKRIKQLIDRGQQISSLVDLTDTQLLERLSTVRQSLTKKPPRVGLIGPNLLVLEHHRETDSRVEVVARWANVDAFMADQSGTDELDVLVVQLPVLLSQTVENIRNFFPKARIISLYQFATDQHLSAVQEVGVPTLRWPVSWPEVEHACSSTAGMPLRAVRTAERRFTDEDLIAIAASSVDPSHCPQHLVELITELNAFADYSFEVSEQAGDAGLYRRVHTDTTHARAQLELALEVIVEADQLLATSQ
jgi:DNA-binding transcriptional MerR regulator